MSLREMARMDAQRVTKDLQAVSRELIFVDADNVEYRVVGELNDIGFSYDSDGGLEIATRGIGATWVLKDLVDASGKVVMPNSKWIMKYVDDEGVEIKTFVSKVSPDRTFGIGHAVVSLDA